MQFIPANYCGSRAWRFVTNGNGVQMQRVERPANASTLPLNTVDKAKACRESPYRRLLAGPRSASAAIAAIWPQMGRFGHA
jgi:hypothetical protein